MFPVFTTHAGPASVASKAGLLFFEWGMDHEPSAARRFRDPSFDPVSNSLNRLKAFRLSPNLIGAGKRRALIKPEKVGRE